MNHPVQSSIFFVNSGRTDTHVWSDTHPQDKRYNLLKSTDTKYGQIRVRNCTCQNCTFCFVDALMTFDGTALEFEDYLGYTFIFRMLDYSGKGEEKTGKR